MANMKKSMPKKPAVSRASSTSSKSATKKLMSNTTKKVKVEGPSNYTANASYKIPMTPKQSMAFGKLAMSPKTADVLFTIPKGAQKLPQKEIDAMQRRRIADRKRTLARAESVIRRTK
jgi:phage/plasmid primase-like uncharacterized protein